MIPRWLVKHAGTGLPITLTDHQVSSAVAGKQDGDLLFDHRWDEGLHHQAGRSLAQSGMAALDLPERPRFEDEVGRVVASAEQQRQLFEQPVGARAPGGGLDGVTVGSDVQGAEARRGARGAPEGSVRLCPEGRVAGAVPKRLQDTPEVQGNFGRHRRTAAAIRTVSSHVPDPHVRLVAIGDTKSAG